jgi:peptidoglycan/xylan/chitin deacetylase (PgdA/CDA1 family)
MTIGSHSENHADMTKVDDQALHNEVTKSRNVLTQHLDMSITDFSYPFGIYNSHVEQAVKDAGYATATTTKEGMATFADDPWQLPRVRMKENTDLAKAVLVSTDHAE